VIPGIAPPWHVVHMIDRATRGHHTERATSESGVGGEAHDS